MRIIVAEDQRISLDALVMLLESIEGIQVVSKHTNGRQVLTALELEKDITMVVSDLNMPIMGGIELTLQIRQRFPEVMICLLTVADEPKVIKEALRAGANGYVLKNAERKELEKALATIAGGTKFYSEDVMRLLTSENTEEVNPDFELPENRAITKREMEVLKLIAKEFSGTEIAEQLYISPATVETHRKHLMQKLGTQTTIGLVKYAIKYNLV